MRRINHRLKKNRNILESLIPSGEDMTKTPKDRLMREGFDFVYFTHTYETKKKGLSITFAMTMAILP